MLRSNARRASTEPHDELYLSMQRPPTSVVSWIAHASRPRTISVAQFSLARPHRQGLPLGGCRRFPDPQLRPRRGPLGAVSTRFPIVRGSAIDGHGWSAGDARNPLRIIELEVVARDGIEPSTRGFSVRRRARFGESKPKIGDELSQGRPNRRARPSLFRTPNGDGRPNPA